MGEEIMIEDHELELGKEIADKIVDLKIEVEDLISRADNIITDIEEIENEEV